MMTPQRGKKSVVVVLLMCLLATVLCGCRTTAGQLARFEQQLVAGNYAAAASESEKLAQKNGDHQLMWQLNAAHANALAGKREAALDLADAAEAKTIKHDSANGFSQSSATVGAVLTNDMAVAYCASGPEVVYNGILKATQYLQHGDTNACQAELNRTIEWQKEYNHRRGKYIDAMMEEIRKEQGEQGRKLNSSIVQAMKDNKDFSGKYPASSFSPSIEMIAAADYMNSYLLHLDGVFRWLNGLPGLGRNSLKTALELAPNNAAVAQDFAECDQGFFARTRPEGQVWVWIESGLCPARAEMTAPILVPVPMPRGGVDLIGATIAMPYLVLRAPGAVNCSVEGTQAQLLLDFDRLVQRDFEIWLKGAIAREVARVSLRIGTQVGMLIAENNTDDPNARMALQMARLGMMVYSVSSSAADIRSVTALPKQVLAVRVARPANGQLRIALGSEKLNVVLPESSSWNTLVFVRKISPMAPAVVHAVSVGSP